MTAVVPAGQACNRRSSIVRCLNASSKGARGGGKTEVVIGEWALHAAQYGTDAIGLMIWRTRVLELDETFERAKSIYTKIGSSRDLQPASLRVSQRGTHNLISGTRRRCGVVSRLEHDPSVYRGGWQLSVTRADP